MARILIVDDEEPVRRMLRKLLSHHGHACETARSATEALTLMRQGRDTELVLADIQMPGPSGIDLATEIAHTYPDTAVVIVSGVDDAETARVAIEAGAYGYLLKPFRASELLITVMNAIRRREAERDSRRHRERLEELVAERTSALTSTMRVLEGTNRRLLQAQEEIIRRLSIASEVRDEETGAHISRMSRYSELIAAELGLAPEHCELIRVASPLHDVGKIGVPDRILQKPGKHTPEEFEIMKMHTVFGYRTLMGTDFELLNLAATVAWTHHEKWDGSGYPRGLRGDAIPIEGRIVAVADVFDALTTRRCYKPAFSLDKALSIIEVGVGKHFDPTVVRCFFARLDDVLAIRRAFPDDDGDAPDDGFELHRLPSVP